MIVDGEFSHVKDDGRYQVWESGANRSDANGKGRYDLLPPYAIHRLAQHYENGAKSHGDRNWELGMPLCRFIESLLRHTFQHLGGDRSEDHMAAVAWNALGFIETEHRIAQGRLPAELTEGLPGEVQEAKEVSQ